MRHPFKRVLALLLTLLLICFMPAGCEIFRDPGDPGDPKPPGEPRDPRFNHIDTSIVSADRTMALIQELTSEKYKGRLVGSEGNRLSAQYIADYFKQIGLQAPAGMSDYMQHYTQPVAELKSKPIMQIVNKEGNVIKELEYSENFNIRCIRKDGNSIIGTFPLYYADTIDKLQQRRGTLQNTILLIPATSPVYRGTYETLDTIVQYGAFGGVVNMDTTSEFRKYSYLTMSPLVGASTAVANSLYMNTEEKTFKALTDAAIAGYSLRIRCNYTFEKEGKAANVIGVIPGSDPDYSDRYIIIGAHFDHVGDNMNGTYNPGALDNASGVAAMMEIARVLKANKEAPKKTIVFIAFNGEETGFYGSRYYTQHPVFPLKTSFMINLDMVGAALDPTLLIISAGASRPLLRDQFYSLAMKFNVKAEKGTSAGTDHMVFGEAGVLAVSLDNMDTRYGYHSKYDTIEGVDKSRLVTVVKIVLLYLDQHVF